MCKLTMQKKIYLSLISLIGIIILFLSGTHLFHQYKKQSQSPVSIIIASDIQDSGTQVLVIPGNHDIHTTAGDYTPEEPVVVENVTSEEFMDMYEAFGPAQALSRDTSTFSYIYEANPYLRILMLDTNLLSKGSVNSNTLEWIEAQLKDAKFAGADELLALYEKYDVKLNLSGHIHVQSIVSNDTTSGISVPEVTVGSLAIGGTPYGEISYDGKTLSYQTQKTDVSAYAVSQNWSDENLLNFNQYSIWYFEEVGRLQSIANLSEKELTDAEKELMANTFASINSRYFLGEKYIQEEFLEGIALWRKQESSFVSRYIETMLKEADVENQRIIIDLSN